MFLVPVTFTLRFFFAYVLFVLLLRFWSARAEQDGHRPLKRSNVAGRTQSFRDKVSPLECGFSFGTFTSSIASLDGSLPNIHKFQPGKALRVSAHTLRPPPVRM